MRLRNPWTHYHNHLNIREIRCLVFILMFVQIWTNWKWGFTFNSHRSFIVGNLCLAQISRLEFYHGLTENRCFYLVLLCQVPWVQTSHLTTLYYKLLFWICVFIVSVSCMFVKSPVLQNIFLRYELPVLIRKK